VVTSSAALRSPAQRTGHYANFALSQPPSSASQDAVREIRDLDPRQRDRAGRATRPASSTEASLIERAPCGRDRRLTTVIVLFLLTGSCYLPLKTLVMNSLTLGATLGILVLAFQAGWLDGPLDYLGPAPWGDQPGLLFAVIFGLATDRGAGDGADQRAV
jgi:RND superfamily putative drug exporter